MAILALNKNTVKLITSTQIITSVFSVVKELVENSLDANAKNIEINLIDNGTTLIEIRDDGCGISATDVPNMAMPHYTSKIQEFSDLDSLTTYGFRGEALNAICRVAEVTVTTKTVQDETAKLYNLDNNGNIIGTELSHRFVGTTVRVKKLFDNLPVRRQLITNPRKSKQEIKQIENLLKSLSICQPIVRMSFRANNNLSLLKPSCNNIKQAMSHIAGSRVVANLEWIHNEDSMVQLQMMIPKQHLTDPQLVYETNEQYIIVNNRPVKYKPFEKMINERISDHFGSQISVKKHPVYLLSITVPSSEVDVNLEPNKTSVLLKNQDDILKKLDRILVDFYNLSDENIRPVMSVSNTSIEATPEYHDFTQNVENEVQAPTVKRPKLNNNKQRAQDFVVDLNTDCDGKRKVSTKRLLNNSLAPEDESCEGNKTSERESIGSILKAFPGPILSDTDSEPNADQEFPSRGNKTPLIIGHAERLNVADKETVEFQHGETRSDSEPLEYSLVSMNAGMVCEVQINNTATGTEANADNVPIETLSQLPVVDLGEDFDIEEILNRPAPPNTTVKLEDIPSSKLKTSECNDNGTSGIDNTDSNAVKSNTTLELWSKGHIPGLKGSTDVSTYSNTKNNVKSNKDSQNKEETNSQTIYHTGFSKFSYEIRSQVLEENPDAGLPTIGKILANRWKELSPEERGYYRDLALEEKKNAEAEKKKLKNKQVSQEEADKNKARLVHMLESMKKTKTNKKCGLNERTTTQWEINIQSITKKFFSKPLSEEDRIVGRLSDKIWVVKSGGKISAVNSADVLEATDSNVLDGQQITDERTVSILESWLKDKSTSWPTIIMHTIHNIGQSRESKETISSAERFASTISRS